MLKKNHNKIHDNHNKKGTTSPHPLPSRRRDLIYRGGQLPVPPRPPSPRLSRRGSGSSVQPYSVLHGLARLSSTRHGSARLPPAAPPQPPRSHGARLRHEALFLPSRSSSASPGSGIRDRAGKGRESCGELRAPRGAAPLPPTWACGQRAGTVRDLSKVCQVLSYTRI